MTVTSSLPALAKLDASPRRLLIDGEWCEAATGELFDTINPANGQVIARIAKGSARDVDRAVAAARKAFEGEWSRVRPYDRQQILLRLAELVDRNFDELAMLDTLEMGAPLSRTKLNRRRALSMIHYYASMAIQLSGETISNSNPGNFLTYTLREPVGVVGAIIPWNVPLSMAIWKIAPALASGCTLVFKPAKETSLTAIRFTELCVEAGVPAGVLNLVTGHSDVGAAIAEHWGIDKVSFTGSTETGRKIIQASAGNIKRLSLELGGKSPDIVLADADLDKAVPGASMATFANAGQICSAGTRLYVERKIYDEFVGRVGEFAASLKVGDGLDLATEMGPVVSKAQFDSVSRYIDSGKHEGARIVTGGQALTDGPLAAGHFLAPTVFADVDDGMTIAREEIFGPVLSAIPFDDLSEVVTRANDTPYGLGAGIWTNNLGKAHSLCKALRSGSVWINCYNLVDPAIPFGGYKMSGYGRESGREHMNEYLNTKAVWVNMD